MIERSGVDVLLSVAESGSIQKTADLLGYTNAGVRYIIQNCEEKLGIRLFYRKYGGVALTNEGREIMPWLRQLKTSEAALLSKARELQNLQAGTIRVAAFNSVAVLWLPGIIEQFQKVYPDVKIEIVMYEDDDYGRKMLRDGIVDCGIYMKPVEDDLSVWDMCKVPIVAIVSPADPVAAGGFFPVDMLGRLPYISGTGEKMIEDIFAKNNTVPDIRFSVENDYSAMALVSKGFGYCLVPESLAEISPAPVVSLELDEPEYMDMVIAVRDSQLCTNSVKTFVEHALLWIRNDVNGEGRA